jgi:hypothetical protein
MGCRHEASGSRDLRLWRLLLALTAVASLIWGLGNEAEQQ